MARFTYEEAGNYGGGNNNFFSLKEDRETAKIRFLLNDINDIMGVSCHEVKVNDKRIDVECIREYNEPVDNCPLCAAGYRVNAKLFIPIYNEEQQQSQIWTRGKTYFDKLSGLCARYNPLVATPFEVERHGKKGDTNTTYEMYPGRTDKSRITDFPEINPEGIGFETHTYDELENFLDTGEFVAETNTRTRQPSRASTNERAVPMRRRPAQNDEEDNF